ncbi:Uncharacterised protein [Yersinia aldovae]|uniref:Uncharacterized protein n=1 Tax=Yersinia aldovae TaxID=29483 RepID=A0ABM9SRW7_YERAL|nr:hypothetical protein AT01_520 [Yersinia aldovae 670-83]CNI92053.1 Uncharacterised protein [Yersinia aldovae]CNK91357.1 Uncharacterised protein [Yersinia aldovae]
MFFSMLKANLWLTTTSNNYSRIVNLIDFLLKRQEISYQKVARKLTDAEI